MFEHHGTSTVEPSRSTLGTQGTITAQDTTTNRSSTSHRMVSPGGDAVRE